MSISLGPFITCFLVIAFLAIYLHIFLYRSKNKTILDIKFIFIAIAVIFLRMCIPLNFSFTYTIYSTRLLPPITNPIYANIGETNLSYFDIFLIVTSTIAVGRLFLLIYRQVRFRRLINLYTLTSAENYPNICSAAERYFTNSIKIAVIPQSISPFITGIMRTTLVFPSICESYSRQELDYICAHEAIHDQNHDLHIKILLEILSCIHWWNPLIYWVKRKYALTLELVNDHQLLDMLSDFQVLEYSELLLKSTKDFSSQTPQEAISFVRNIPSDLNVRISALLNYSTTTEIKQNASIGHKIMLFLVMIFCLFVVVDPSNRGTPIDEADCFEMNPENAYFLVTPDGYDLYVENQYMCTLTELPSDAYKYHIYTQTGGEYE